VQTVADRTAITEAERVLGFSLPGFYVRLLTEVANGGFGPGYGIIGVPPDGYQESDLCGIFSYVDCLTPSARVITDEVIEDGLNYTETSPSLVAWLTDWARGVDLEKDMHEITGYREGINPFTGKPHRFPIRRGKGASVDFSDRA
jgi:hypothetical protein